LRDVWPVIEPLMIQVVDGSHDTYTMPTLLEDVMAGQVRLWAVVQERGVRALVGTEIVQSRSGLVSCVIRFCVGKRLNDWIHLIDEIEEYARAAGCDRLETWARKGWAKHLPDFKLTHILLEKDL
jgi:hypothetical protein